MTATISLDGQPCSGTHSTCAVEGSNSVPTGHTHAGSQDYRAGGDGPTPEQANAFAAPMVPAPAQGSTPPAPANVHAAPNRAAPVLADPFLSLAAEVLDDLEKVRIANENRYRQLTRSVADVDGGERGFGLDESNPDVRRLRALVDALAIAEHQATLNLNRMMRAHPLGPWVKATRGVGEKQGARLLAAIGDPYWNGLHDRPRTVSELWAYCGYHPVIAGGNPDQSSLDAQKAAVRVAAKRARGQKANWSADAKMRAHLIAESIMKAGGPYREIYDATRVKYADALHEVECKQCGPKGNPALVGSPLSDGHKHARALRAVAKEVLKGLWREAKRLHEEVAPA